MDLGDAISELEWFVGILANFDNSQAGYYAIKPTKIGKLTNF